MNKRIAQLKRSSRRYFTMGYLSALRMTGTSVSKNGHIGSYAEDAKKIAGDWKNVGNDLNAAAEKVMNNNDG